MGTFLTFISGPWGALIEKALLVALVVGGIIFAYKDITGAAARDQALRDQNAQIIQVEKDNQSLSRKLDIIQKDNQDILVKLNNENNKVIETNNEVTHYIESPQAQQSNQEPVPDVISNTIGILRHAQ